MKMRAIIAVMKMGGARLSGVRQELAPSLVETLIYSNTNITSTQ